MDHIIHLRNQFKPINTFAQSYDYTTTLIKRGKRHFLFFENWMVIICTKLNPLHPRIVCTKFGWNWPSDTGGGEEDFVNVFSLFHYYPPLEKGVTLHLKKNPLYPRMLCAKFGWSCEEDVYSQTDNRQSEKLSWAFSQGELIKVKAELTS